RTRLGHRRRAAHARPARPSSNSRRRQHAYLWKKLEPTADDRTRRISSNVASAGTSPRARCLAPGGDRRRTTIGDRSMPHLHHGGSGLSPVSLIFPILAALVYLRGWLHLRTASLNVIEAWRAGSFVLGLFSIWVALASPIAVWDQTSLTGHMIQHLLLMTF